jgi:hypothetical protein
MNLGDMLKRDFNLELNISGGFGQTRDDPVVVLDSDSIAASTTQMQVLKGLGMGRGILWRTLTRNPIIIGQANIEQILIETKEVTESQIITQQESYYFDVSKANSNGKPLPEVIVLSDNQTKLDFPYELGWLHFSGSRGYEIEVAGAGKSISYNALGIKATIYLYDNLRSDIPADIDSSVIRNEFESAVSCLMVDHPAAERLGELSKTKSFILQAFNYEGDFSIIGLGVFRGNFIKLRITHAQDPLLINISNQFIFAVEANVMGNIIMH